MSTEKIIIDSVLLAAFLALVGLEIYVLFIFDWRPFGKRKK